MCCGTVCVSSGLRVLTVFVRKKNATYVRTRYVTTVGATSAATEKAVNRGAMLQLAMMSPSGKLQVHAEIGQTRQRARGGCEVPSAEAY